MSDITKKTKSPIAKLKLKLQQLKSLSKADRALPNNILKKKIYENKLEVLKEEQQEQQQKVSIIPPIDKHKKQPLVQRLRALEERGKLSKVATKKSNTQNTGLSNSSGNLPKEKKLRKAAERLLADIYDIFNTTNDSKITTRELITTLCSDDTKPWAKYCEGKLLNSRRLASLLEQFGIGSVDIRFGTKINKGYEKEEVEFALQSLSKT